MPKVRHSSRPNKNLSEEKKSQRFDEFSNRNGRATVQAAEMIGTNRQYVADAKAIQEKAPEVLQAVRNTQPRENGIPVPRSIAEKVSSAYFEQPLRSFLDTEELASTIADIIGGNRRIPSRILQTQASEMASLLINIRHELSLGKQAETVSLLSDAIEICFLHTPVYEAALEAYRLECIGELMGAQSTAELLQDIIGKSTNWKAKKGENQHDEENQSQ